MSYILFTDRSQWNGVYDALGDPNLAVALKMSGGDAGLYFDSQASVNYSNASAAGKVIIGYHFAGGSDPIGEAAFFLRAMSPLAENDILALDWEIQHADPVGWCTAFVNHIHEQTGIWPLVYMNMSTANAYDWSPVFNNCGYWCAAPSYSFDDTLPVKYPQIAQQGPIVNGIDTDAFFGTIDQLKAYGYHATSPSVLPEAPPSVPVPEPTAPVEAPPSVPVQPLTTEQPGTNGSQPEVPVTPPIESQSTPVQNWIIKLINLIKKVVGIK